MKTILFIAFISLGILVNAQKNTVPDVVKNAFTEKYSDTDDYKIKKRKDTYRFSFKNVENPCVATFNSDGTWIDSKTTIKRKNFPIEVSNSINKKFSNGSYSSGQLIETSDGLIYYELDIDTPNSYILVEISPAGKILNSKKKEKPKDTPVKSSGEEE